MTLSEYFAPKTNPTIQEGSKFLIKSYGGSSLCVLCQVGPGVFQAINLCKGGANRMADPVIAGIYGPNRFTAEIMTKIFGYPLDQIELISDKEALAHLNGIWA